MAKPTNKRRIAKASKVIRVTIDADVYETVLQTFKWVGKFCAMMGSGPGGIVIPPPPPPPPPPKNPKVQKKGGRNARPATRKLRTSKNKK